MTLFEIEGSERFSSTQSCEACGAKDGTALLSHQTATGITPGHASSGSMLVAIRASSVRTNALPAVEDEADIELSSVEVHL
jgi:hypothetical protein